MIPRRVQRQRTKGWKMPPNTVYVGRPTVWGNPYRVGDWTHEDPERQLAAQDCVDLYAEYIADYIGTEDLALLFGKNLACWCPLDRPCHADVLLNLTKKMQARFKW